MRRLALRSAVVLCIVSLPALVHATTFDPTFGTGGIATVLADGEGEAGFAVQADAKYVILGTQTLYPHRDIVLARFDVDGGLDPMFGTGGLAVDVLDGDGDGQPYDLLALPDGKLLIVTLIATAPNVYTTA